MTEKLRWTFFKKVNTGGQQKKITLYGESLYIIVSTIEPPLFIFVGFQGSIPIFALWHSFIYISYHSIPMVTPSYDGKKIDVQILDYWACNVMGNCFIMQYRRKT